MYPSMSQVEEANRMTLDYWNRFLRSPKDDNEVAILNLIVERFRSEWMPPLYGRVDSRY